MTIADGRSRSLASGPSIETLPSARRRLRDAGRGRDRHRRSGALRTLAGEQCEGDQPIVVRQHHAARLDPNYFPALNLIAEPRTNRLCGSAAPDDGAGSRMVGDDAIQNHVRRWQLLDRHGRLLRDRLRWRTTTWSKQRPVAGRSQAIQRKRGKWTIQRAVLPIGRSMDGVGGRQDRGPDRDHCSRAPAAQVLHVGPRCHGARSPSVTRNGKSPLLPAVVAAAERTVMLSTNT